MCKLRLWSVVGLMAAAFAPLYGCGSECASGTVDDSGQCIVDTSGCAEGTKLRDGQCVLNSTGCGPNTMLEGTACVPVPEICQEGATFDQGSHRCEPNAEVVCGPATEVGADGWCVPGGDACADTTLLDDGRCIVGAPSCGDGTELDPATGKCMLVKAGCGSGLAYESDSGTCVPTDDICKPGTEFDADAGLCLNASCRRGDALVDGQCMSVGEAVARQPDLRESENNDPFYEGGAAQTLILGSADAEPTTFAGAIGEPIDLDGDGAADQDRDVYQFEAAAGEWFDIQVYSIGLQAPAFTVEGPEDFVRYSPVGRGVDARRMIVAPSAGTYTITVVPSLVLQGGSAASVAGGADWTYAASVDTMSAPEDADVDLSSNSGQITGDYPELSDNLFHFTGVETGDILRLTANIGPSDADAIAQVWSTADGLSSSTDLTSGSVEVVASGTSTSVLLDYKSLDGPATGFDFDVDVVGAQQTSTIPPGSSEVFTVPTEVGDKIVATQQNSQDIELKATIADAAGTELAADEAMASKGVLAPEVDIAGVYTVTFKNTSSNNVDASLSAKSRTPADFGQIADGDTATTGQVAYAKDGLEKIAFSVTPDQIIEIYHDNSGEEDHQFELYDAQGDKVNDETSFYPLSDSSREYMYWYAAQGGSFELQVEPEADVTDEEVFVHVYTPELLAFPAAGSAVSRANPNLLENRSDLYKADIGVDGRLKIIGTSGGGGDIDATIFDTAFEEVKSFNGSSDGINAIGSLDTGSYLVAIEGDISSDLSYDVTFELIAPPAPPQFGSTPGVAIPDSDPSGVSDSVTVSGCASITKVTVFLGITHSFRGDLAVDLTSPAGTTIRVWDGTGGSADDLIGWMPQTLTPANSLNGFNGENANGQWTLKVSDGLGGFTGTLNEWGLTLSCQ